MRESKGIAYERSVGLVSSYLHSMLRRAEYVQKPSVAIEMTVLKPVNVPKYIEFRATWTRHASKIAYNGTCRFESTFEKRREKGRPLSRANAYRLLEPSAKRALAQINTITTIIEDRKQVPTTDPVEL